MLLTLIKIHNAQRELLPEYDYRYALFVGLNSQSMCHFLTLSNSN